MEYVVNKIFALCEYFYIGVLTIMRYENNLYIEIRNTRK
nr:MAG TPA: hypothetical protein [Caudoviricetes sp.]